uniref:Uncharacterized protein n=1 Tax=Anguilla anguilla TaxID=7936 RepID=A0A0E9VRV0_ANGAN
MVPDVRQAAPSVRNVVSLTLKKNYFLPINRQTAGYVAFHRSKKNPYHP